MDRLRIILLLLLITFAGQAQEKGYFLTGKESYKENLLLKANDQFFIPGERVFFTLYNSFGNGKPSFISKIAYVELINSGKHSVLRTMVELEKGYGFGHLYLPSHLETGDYQLIAYTSWMRNFDLNLIPGENLKVVNPYVPLPVKKDSFFIEFYPEGGSYSKGTNKVFYSTTHKTFKARVVGPTGAEVVEFASREKPYGTFNITLSDPGNYKVIISDQHDSIYFHDLTIEELVPHQLTATDAGTFFSINARNAIGHILKIYSVHEQDTVVSMDVTEKSVTEQIAKNSLPAGLLRITLAGLQKHLERIVFNDPETAHVKLSIDKNVYGTRQKAELVINAADKLRGETVVVQVRKKYAEGRTVHIPQALFTAGLLYPDESVELEAINERLISQMIALPQSPGNEINHLPDFRGQLVSGKSGERQTIFLSSSTPANKLLAARANNYGRFHFNITGLYGENNIILRASEKVAVLDDPFISDHSFIKMHNIPVDSRMMKWLERKSIDVQVENAYYQSKMDSAITGTSSLLNNEIDQSYNLDDYTRFPNTIDIIVEIIEEVSLRSEDGKQKLVMPYIKNPSGNVDSALVLINGIPADIKYLLDFNPALFEKVDLIQGQIKLGAAEYRGIVNFITSGEETLNLFLQKGYSIVELQGPQPKYAYFRPDHSQPSVMQQRIPDFRNQLLWEPEVILMETIKINFFTSDLTGTFEVVVFGYTTEGRLIYGKEEFIVNE